MYVEKQGFLPGLHVLRGLAAVATIFFHLRFMMPEFSVNHLAFVEQFGAGVTLFFILSCFSLFHSTGRKLEHKNWIAGYVYRRFFRIYPLFLSMLVFHLLAHYMVYGKVYSLAEIGINTLVLYPFFPGQHASIVWAGWTIGVEVAFYCVFPLLFSVSRSLTFWGVVFLLSLLVSAGIPGIVSALKLDVSYAYMSFPRQLFVFIFGGLVYILANKYGQPIYKNAALAVSLILFLIWTLVVKGYLQVLQGSGMLLVKVVAIGLFVYFFYDKKFLYNKFTRFLGEVSYTIYLSHPVIIALCKPFLNKLYDYGLPVDVVFMVSFLFVFIVVCIVSYVVNKYLEMPIYYFGVRRAKQVELES